VIGASLSSHTKRLLEHYTVETKHANEHQRRIEKFRKKIVNALIKTIFMAYAESARRMIFSASTFGETHKRRLFRGRLCLRTEHSNKSLNLWTPFKPAIAVQPSNSETLSSETKSDNLIT
jgi:hypothetical protein